MSWSVSTVRGRAVPARGGTGSARMRRALPHAVNLSYALRARRRQSAERLRQGDKTYYGHQTRNPRAAPRPRGDEDQVGRLEHEELLRQRVQRHEYARGSGHAVRHEPGVEPRPEGGHHPAHRPHRNQPVRRQAPEHAARERGERVREALRHAQYRRRRGEEVAAGLSARQLVRAASKALRARFSRTLPSAGPSSPRISASSDTIALSPSRCSAISPARNDAMSPSIRCAWSRPPSSNLSVCRWSSSSVTSSPRRFVTL